MVDVSVEAGDEKDVRTRDRHQRCRPAREDAEAGEDHRRLEDPVADVHCGCSEWEMRNEPADPDGSKLEPFRQLGEPIQIAEVLAPDPERQADGDAEYSEVKGVAWFCEEA